MGPAGRSLANASPRYVEEARRLSGAARPRLSAASRQCLSAAGAESRSRDDDHVGTEHVLLALWAVKPNAAVDALETLGMTRALLCAQFCHEPGSSPTGAIPLIPRAVMIVGPADLEADRLGSRTIGPEHLLLGAIREDEDRETTKIGGPRRSVEACRAAGSDLRVLQGQVERRD
jgi:ATP-dependent Clp protease ATP-binding subunit ClpA